MTTREQGARDGATVVARTGAVGLRTMHKGERVRGGAVPGGATRQCLLRNRQSARIVRDHRQGTVAERQSDLDPRGDSEDADPLVTQLMTSAQGAHEAQARPDKISSSASR
jgi:hypothetical protein